ncbi:hypothetical protein V2J09_021856 [Rumex salicifolius]
MAPSLLSAFLLILLFFSLSPPPSHAATERSSEEVRGLYEWWLAKYQRKSSNSLIDDEADNQKRFEIFSDNLRFIDEHNSVPGRTYKLGLNKFADLTNDEYRSRHFGMRFDQERLVFKAKNPNPRYAISHGDRLPKSVDWRALGAVSAVKDQGQCDFTALQFEI